MLFVDPLYKTLVITKCKLNSSRTCEIVLQQAEKTILNSMPTWTVVEESTRQSNVDVCLPNKLLVVNLENGSVFIISSGIFCFKVCPT